MKRGNKLFPVWATGAAMVLVLVATACQPSGAVDGTALPPSATASTVQETGTADASATVMLAATSTGEQPDAGGREMRLTPTPLPSLERVPVSELTPVTGEVPQDLLDTILQDAEARTGIAAGEMNIVRAEAVIWNDGSLGCPQPDVMYTQAPVDGYWVVLQADGQELDYRAAQTGDFSLCEHPLPLPGGAAAPTPKE